ncbi:MAG: nucleotidyltransferase domain-containing protein [Phenylobacterium sp.]|uniref:nucleotidyltransferase family protein n=1 Tax=Phenylobacterium sp. TaxID=1871053 RepID=UPI001A459C15|nr:nucleotidyltransferase domain-containing protein [Phenylobacterium sp.]MBL8773790.1 nucleotidyltransferase domain-containing protein [Phenylobacterium sp.]
MTDAAAGASLLEQALVVIRSRRGDAREHGIELLGVVGSVARGEARPDSDVDVAYAIVGKSSLFDLGGLAMDIQGDLGRRVDMVDLTRLKPAFRASMERDLVRA